MSVQDFHTAQVAVVTTLAVIAGSFAVLVSGSLWMKTRGSALKAAARTVENVMHTLDLNSLAHSLSDGSFVQKRKTMLGGLFSVVGVCVFVGFASSAIFQRATSNTLTTVSLDPASEQVVAQAQAIQSSSWILPAWHEPSFDGLAVVMITAGDPGVCTFNNFPWQWTSVRGPWQPQYEYMPCSDPNGVGAQLVRHVFSCRQCVLLAGSQLTLTLPWGCQSVSLTAFATSPDGRLSVSAASAAARVTDHTASLLSSIDWQVQPMLVLRNDTTTGSLTRGYQLLAGSLTTAYSAAGVTILPASAAVDIRVKLSPAQLYSTITLQEKTSLLQLLAQIAGFTAIFGLIRMMFSHTEACGNRIAACASRRRVKAVSSLGSKPEAPATAEGVVSHTNELNSSAHPRTALFKAATNGVDVAKLQEEAQTLRTAASEHPTVHGGQAHFPASEHSATATVKSQRSLSHENERVAYVAVPLDNRAVSIPPRHNVAQTQAQSPGGHGDVGSR